MATEVLHPQDILIGRFRLLPAEVLPRRRNFHNNNNSHRGFNHRTTRKPAMIQKKIVEPSAISAASASSSPSSKDPRSAKSLVMRQVTILKRGEPLEAKKVKGEETARIGPYPEIVPVQIRIIDPASPPPPVSLSPLNVYAGSAFTVSPSPESLPLPSFSKKKKQVAASMAVHDSATRDLRRLLRLDG